MTDKIKTEVQKQPGSKVKISFRVPFSEFEKFIKNAGVEMSQKMKIDGFRQGKAPFPLIEKTIGRQKLIEAGVEKAVKRIYVDTVLEKKIEVIGRPRIDIKKIAWDNDLEFEAVSAIMPKVELNDWEEPIKSINEEYKGKKYEVKKDEIERELDFLANQRAKLVAVNRPAQKNDQLQIDFEVYKDGVAIEGGTARDHSVIIGKGGFIPGFEDNLIGLEANQEKEFDLDFPGDYHQKHLAGVKANFKVKIKLVQERQVPEIDDNFASGIGKFKNLEELRKNLEEGIEREKEHRDKTIWQDKIVKKLIENTKTEIPEVLVESEVSRMEQELESSIAQMGLDKKTYFQQLKTTEENIKKQWRDKDAQDRVKAGLALREISRKKKIEPTKEEIEMRINQILQYYKAISDAEKEIDPTGLYESVKAELTNQKVLEHLMEL
ncbi:MAG: trigger factor [Candidatus Moranbacteria bacterium]|nr:trigger factor [Candidatus Moranbacteria bacterium]